jgi:hypothetical protein
VVISYALSCTRLTIFRRPFASSGHKGGASWIAGESTM